MLFRGELLFFYLEFQLLNFHGFCVHDHVKCDCFLGVIVRERNLKEGGSFVL